MATRYGGEGRVSTKAKLADELVILGEVLVRARDRAGMKQTDVAQRLGVPASWLSKVESGTRRLDVIELIRIAEALEVEAGALVDEVCLALLTAGREARNK
jgi:transcriptional regulator with XRE-family HTH domain